MRLVVSLVLLVVFIGLLGFALTNFETRVPITIFETTHPDVRLFAVVIVAALFGATCVGLVALVEGTALRIANRRLEREVARLESELNYARTQPLGPPRPEPDALAGTRAPAESAEPAEVESSPPSRPVYEPESGDWNERDPGDDAYSGGRAV
ncbi:MAG TPA: LapA family protein [Candidatus Polarisedimenticolaceae bacterium]